MRFFEYEHYVIIIYNLCPGCKTNFFVNAANYTQTTAVLLCPNVPTNSAVLFFLSGIAVYVKRI